MIEFEGVTKIYSNGAIGLQGVSFKIEKNEFVFVVGQSGSGKSSFLKLLMKEIEPTEGRLIVNGRDITKLKHREIPHLRRSMGMVFQDFRLLPNKTVYDNVAFAMQVVEAPQRDIRRNVPMVLSLVGLEKKARAYPNQLSGGEQQRTSLARAIINNPPILLADEPTGNLDPDTAWDIMKLLNDINHRGTTVVIATHAKDIVNSMQKRVITLNSGQLARDLQSGGYNSEA